ncbi:MAG: PTS sugar transporter subunit IIB [Anaerolineaceae bacterium]|nr:PTS sugar transporter subunit IIB [Anaerolineaceae bacterium]
MRIMVVCGFGLGSSLILKMTLDDVLRENHLKAETFCSDAETARGQDFNLVLTSAELVGLFSESGKPVVVISDFLSKAEVALKALPTIRELMQTGS